MSPEEERLYNIYSGWTGQLHHYCVKELGQDLNVEFFPDSWEMRLYAGPLQEKSLQPWGFSTVPGFVRPKDSRPFKLPRPETEPSEVELEQAFRALCYAAALVLKIDLGKRKLSSGLDTQPTRTLPPSDKS